ncbi:MAG: DUF4357 domain-containing protein [Victivallales bacterium]
MIKLLAEADKDYNLLLKASILTGQFPDYRLYKRKKQEKLKKTKDSARIQQELEEFKKRLNCPEARVASNMLIIPVDTRWVNRMDTNFHSAKRYAERRADYHIFWKHLSSWQKKIAEKYSPEYFDNSGDYVLYRDQVRDKVVNRRREEIQERLALNPNNWDISSNISAYLENIATISSKHYHDFNIKSTKNENSYDTDSEAEVIFSSGFVTYDHPETEELKFISIYQNHLFSATDKIFTVKEALKSHFITTHNGRQPDNLELGALRQRYYRFIRKSYLSAEMRHDENLLDNREKGTVSTDTVYLPRRKNVFYLHHGKKKEGNSATLIWNVKKNCCYLMRGSKLANTVDAIEDFAISNFIQTKLREKRLKKLDGGYYRVLRTTEVRSPSFAARLVCGYKRNGLNCWKNQGKTLRDFLKSYNVGSRSKLNSKSGSASREGQK